MTNSYHSLPLAAALLLVTTSPALAATRAEMAVHPAGDTRVADMPAGHWATNATQVVLANNVLTLQDGAFHGNALLTGAELNAALESLTSIAETIASKGSNARLRAAIGSNEAGDGPVSRLELAQALSSFLDACASEQLVAIAASNNDAPRFKDLGAAVPAAVSTVVDRYKVMTGYPDNTFHPTESVTRYQMAAIAFNILNTMRIAPLAQRPVFIQGPAPEPKVIVVHDAPVPVAVVPPAPKVRDSFRQRSPYHLDYQAVNVDNVSGGNPFAVVPLSAMITGYQGPLMLQNVTNVRVNVLKDNMVDTEFRAGYAGFKWGMFQAIPYVGVNLGLGTSIPSTGTQYDTFVGATYGGILSLTPSDNVELYLQGGQAALLGGGRFNSSFQATNYPNVQGGLPLNYSLGADFYVAQNMCLSVGFGGWQDPAGLRVGSDDNAGGMINTLGGTLGVGSTF